MRVIRPESGEESVRILRRKNTSGSENGHIINRFSDISGYDLQVVPKTMSVQARYFAGLKRH